MNNVTAEAHARMIAELTQLREVDMPNAYDMILHARGAGDIAENNDFHIACEDYGRLERRANELDRIIAASVVIGTLSGETVEPGVKVVLDFGGDSEEFVVGSLAERHGDLDVLTTDSPLGAALLGRSAGDDVEYASPTGVLRVRIVRISV